ncbi:MAG: ABC transporter permease [Lachnospiraceae bacterium]|nr:ABC transporter permease [Lachnospiraceae bacterium]
MGYFLKLSLRYIRKNPARTAYSVLGISLTALMCFALVTAFYSWWDYDYLDYYRQYPFELCVPFSDEVWTQEMIENAKRMEKEETIEKLTVRVRDTYSSRMVFSSQMQRGEKYALWIKLKDTSHLQASADFLSEKYHFEVEVNSLVAMYLRQDDSGSTAMLNLLLSLFLMIFGSFFVAIIRNTMLIAVTERVRDYGLLRCVGMSEGQLRFLLSVEGLLMSLAASLAGIAIGYGGMQLMEPWIRTTLGLSEVFRFGFYPKAVILTVLLAAAVTLFSLIEPSRQAGQVSPLDALHGIYSNAQRPKKKKLPSGGLEEKLFGAAGFYAKRNFKRGRGHQWAVFLAMFFSVAFLLTVLAFCNSFTATIKRDYKLDSDGVSEYRESLKAYSQGSVGSVYVPEDVSALRAELETFSDVEDVVTVLSDVMSLEWMCTIAMDPEIRALTEAKTLSYAYELAYDAEGMEKERQFLVEGEIDYERMKAENGILLCDVGGDGERKTSYRPGDVIRALSPEGAARALADYCSVIAEVSERHGMNAWMDAQGRIVYYEGGEQKTRAREASETHSSIDCLATKAKQGLEDDAFIPLQEEVLECLKKKGIDCTACMKEDSIRMTDVLHALEEREFEAGYADSYAVMGILSDDFYERVRGYSAFGRRENWIRIIYPQETMLAREEENRTQAQAHGFSQPERGMYRGQLEINAFGHGFDTEIGIRRDMELLNPKLQRFAQKLNNWDYSNKLDSGNDYFESVQYLKVVRMVVVILGTFIIIICMIQIINTLQANMRLRRKELWLYDVVGMSRSQRLKMQLVEHGFSALAALLLAMLISFLGSFGFIKGLLELGEDTYVYRWPWLVALLLSAAVFGILFLVNHLELNRSE